MKLNHDLAYKTIEIKHAHKGTQDNAIAWLLSNCPSKISSTTINYNQKKVKILQEF
jgi:hypothetical protein